MPVENGMCLAHGGLCWSVGSALQQVSTLLPRRPGLVGALCATWAQAHLSAELSSSVNRLTG